MNKNTTKKTKTKKQEYYYPRNYNEDTHSSFQYESYNKTCINNQCTIKEHDQCEECVTHNGRTVCRRCIK